MTDTILISQTSFLFPIFCYDNILSPAVVLMALPYLALPVEDGLTCTFGINISKFIGSRVFKFTACNVENF